jgi:hypothetical protein
MIQRISKTTILYMMFYIANINLGILEYAYAFHNLEQSVCGDDETDGSDSKQKSDDEKIFGICHRGESLSEYISDHSDRKFFWSSDHRLPLEHLAVFSPPPEWV